MDIYPEHRKIADNLQTIALVAEFITFTGSTWSGSREKQAETFASAYPEADREMVSRSALVVMDNYSIDGLVSNETVARAWELGQDSVGVDFDALMLEREYLQREEQDSASWD